MANAPQQARYAPRTRLGCYVGAPLWGVVAGVLLGAYVYAPLMAARDPMADTPLRGKTQAVYQCTGVIYGIPIGALCGLAAGVLLWRLDHKSRVSGNAV